MSLRQFRNAQRQVKRTIQIDQGRTYHSPVFMGAQKRTNVAINEIVQIHNAPYDPIQDLDPDSVTFGQFEYMMDYDDLGA